MSEERTLNKLNVIIDIEGLNDSGGYVCLNSGTEISIKLYQKETLCVLAHHPG